MGAILNSLFITISNLNLLNCLHTVLWFNGLQFTVTDQYLFYIDSNIIL